MMMMCAHVSTSLQQHSLLTHTWIFWKKGQLYRPEVILRVTQHKIDSEKLMASGSGGRYYSRVVWTPHQDTEARAGHLNIE